MVHNSRQDNQGSREQRPRFVWFLMTEKCAGGTIRSVGRALDLREKGRAFNSQGQTNTQGPVVRMPVSANLWLKF